MLLNGMYENELYVHPYLTISVSESFPLHQHRHLELCCVMAGTANVILDGRSFSLSEGDVMFVSPYCLHAYEMPHPEGLPTLFKALFEPECFGTFGELLLQYSLASPILRAKELHSCFPHMKEMLESLAERFHCVRRPEEYVEDLDELTHLLSVLVRLSGIEPTDNADDSLFIRAVKQCCKCFVEESFTVSRLAAELKVSASRLQQLFSQNLQLSVKEYITLLRINKAQSYLTETNMSIIDIAYYCGYGTVRSFNRSFMSICGVTPTAYRLSCLHGEKMQKSRKILSNFEQFYPDVMWPKNGNMLNKR